MPVTEGGRVRKYFAPFHGHDVEDLRAVHATLRREHDGGLVFLAGDSSLDNKYWFESWADAERGYDAVLDPPRCKRDVCYWINREISRVERERSERSERSGVVASVPSLACLNTAIEATTLDDRAMGTLLPQDAFIRDHLRPEDVLIVSVGGNDVALAPTLGTALNVATLVHLVPKPLLESFACVPLVPNLAAFPCDLGRAGCGLQGCLSGLAAFPPGFGYLVDLFGNRVQNYARRLCAKTKPRKILVCCIYFPAEKTGEPEETETPGWADGALSALRYDHDPGKLQLAIRKIFEHATRRVTVPGVQVVPVPLFEALDAKDARDYEQRVEPSATGGEKMAKAFAEHLW